MELKLTIQGVLIYTTMALYGIAMAAALVRHVRVARLLYVGGFLAALASYLYRWQHSGHVPMQNLFEVFLTLGVLILPITLLCRRLWGIESLAADLFLGLVVLFVVSTDYFIRKRANRRVSADTPSTPERDEEPQLTVEVQP